MKKLIKGKRKRLKSKINRRVKNKYGSLDPALNLKSRYEEIVDVASYANTLPEKEREWLAKFVNEYVCAAIGPKPLHKTKKLKKSVYDKNNARWRCVFNRGKAQNNLMSLEEVRLKGEDSKDD